MISLEEAVKRDALSARRNNICNSFRIEFEDCYKGDNSVRSVRVFIICSGIIGGFFPVCSTPLTYILFIEVFFFTYRASPCFSVSFFLFFTILHCFSFTTCSLTSSSNISRFDSHIQDVEEQRANYIVFSKRPERTGTQPSPKGEGESSPIPEAVAKILDVVTLRMRPLARVRKLHKRHVDILLSFLKLC